jgi:hypothetical protein
VAAVQTTHVLEEDEMLTVRAMEGFHGFPWFMAVLEAQLDTCRKTCA